MKVTLSPVELTLAGLVGMQRQIQALREGRPDRHGAHGYGWGLHIEGAAGEAAFAKAADRYWSAPVGTYKAGGDVGAVQVRTRSRHDYELIVRKDDRPSDVFVLVTGQAPHFEVRGWIYAEHAMQPRWSRSHGGRPPAYFVPHDQLYPLSALPRGGNS